MNKIFSRFTKKPNLSIADDHGMPITGARRPLTGKKMLTGVGTKDEIKIPMGCYEVNIKSTSEVVFYESATTYIEEGVEYGAGYPGTNMTFPTFDLDKFWLEGTGTVTLLFSSIREV